MRINFKSTPENFKKEYLGLKRNTIRKFEADKLDHRKQVLDDFRAGKINILEVEIQSSVSTSENFVRSITDVTAWNNIYIISW